MGLVPHLGSPRASTGVLLRSVRVCLCTRFCSVLNTLFCKPKQKEYLNGYNFNDYDLIDYDLSMERSWERSGEGIRYFWVVLPAPFTTTTHPLNHMQRDFQEPTRNQIPTPIAPV